MSPAPYVPLDMPTAEVFDPLLEPARDKGAWGGRGSGKSHFFAGLLIEDAMRHPGENGGDPPATGNLQTALNPTPQVAIEKRSMLSSCLSGIAAMDARYVRG